MVRSLLIVCQVSMITLTTLMKRSVSPHFEYLLLLQCQNNLKVVLQLILQATSHSLHILVRELLSDKGREDIPGVSDLVLLPITLFQGCEAVIYICLVYH